MPAMQEAEVGLQSEASQIKKCKALSGKVAKTQRPGNVAYVAEYLLSQREALNSNTSTTYKKKGRERDRERTFILLGFVLKIRYDIYSFPLIIKIYINILSLIFNHDQ
jgi:hypothetical protein